MYLLYGILRPIQILVLHVIVPLLVSKEVRTVHLSLKNRIRFLLRRTSGMMKSSSALVQHFNPICRAARAFPEYSISRLLMSLNDFDVPRPRVWELRLLFDKSMNSYNAVMHDKPDPTNGLRISWANILLEVLTYPFYVMNEIFVYIIPVRLFEITINMICLAVLHSAVVLLSVYCGGTGVIASAVLLGLPGALLLLYVLCDASLQAYGLQNRYRHPAPELAAKAEDTTNHLDTDGDAKPISVVKSKPWLNFGVGFNRNATAVHPVTGALEDFIDELETIGGLSHSTVSRHDLPALDFSGIPAIKHGRMLAAAAAADDEVSATGPSVGSRHGSSRKKKPKSKHKKHEHREADLFPGFDDDGDGTVGTAVSLLSDRSFSTWETAQSKYKIKHQSPTKLSMSLMPLEEEPAVSSFRYASPRRSKRQPHPGPGRKSDQMYSPLEKNLHPGRYLMQLVNISSELDLPPLDALGQYLGFYSSGSPKTCPVKYCLGRDEHASETDSHGHDEHDNDPSQEDSQVTKTKYPLWF